MPWLKTSAVYHVAGGSISRKLKGSRVANTPENLGSEFPGQIGKNQEQNPILLVGRSICLPLLCFAPQ